MVLIRSFFVEFVMEEPSIPRKESRTLEELLVMYIQMPYCFDCMFY